MKSCWLTLAAALSLAVPFGAMASPGQQTPSSQTRSTVQDSPQNAPQTLPQSDTDHRAEIYYDVAMGHLYQQEYETSSRSEDAGQAIEFYKKAYALDPASQEIGEQLAEMYLISQRIRDAVNEAQEVIRRDPDNLPARLLLARIYVRALGDLSNSSDQRQTVTLAIDQFKQIVRLDPSDSESALWLARLYRISNENDEAERVLRGILAHDPENQGAVEQITQLMVDENKPAEAISLLEQMLQRAPSGPLYDRLGDAYEQTHDLAKAEQAYRHAIELEPDQPNHRRGLAQCLFDEEKYKEALAEYQKLAEAEPDEANNYLRLSEIYRQLHDLDDAEKEALLAKQHAPGNLEVIYNEATIYESEGRYEDAIQLLSDAVADVKAEAETTPSRQRTLGILYQLLGQLYREAQNYPAAVNTYEEMLRLGQGDGRRAFVLIIDTYRLERDLPAAMEEARKGVAAYPMDRPLRISQAMLLGENNQPDEAAQSLRSLLNNSAGDLEIDLDIAQIYEQARRFGDAEQAAHSAEKLAERPSDRATIGLLLGGIYERQKKYDQAEQMFKKVLALDPNNAPVLNYYGYMLADRGTRLDEAVGFVQRALAEDPNNAAYLDSLGWAYYKQNKLMDAETYLRKAVDHESHDPTMLSHLGDVLAKSGRTDLAAMEWEKSVAEWRRALPADFEPDKVAELEQKISTVRRRLAQQKRPAEAKPN